MREAIIKRDTKETKIKMKLNLDGSGQTNINTGIGFIDHMLDLFAFHGDFDLDLECNGDLNVDSHHSVEDIGIVLGKRINEALGDKKGITRYGFFRMPMDETLFETVLDMSGRSYLVYNASVSTQVLGNYETEMTEEFFRAIAMNCGMTLHMNLIYGSNTHHIIEAAFKSFGRALKQAVSIDESHKDKIVSSKGVL